MNFKKYILIAAFAVFILGCVKSDDNKNGKLKVVATTSMIADIVKNVGGNFVDVRPLMSSGVDPHQYKASEGDVLRLAGADAIFHNGLHLEGKLGEILDRMEGSIPTYAISEYIPSENLIYHGSSADPHIWFDVNLWILAVNRVADGLSEADPGNELYYRQNEHSYVQQLILLNEELKNILSVIPPKKRVLVTSHDAFSYFGKAFGWKVIGIQGVNTMSETSVNDIASLARRMAELNVDCIFVETSVSPRAVEALIDSAEALGVRLRKGNALYSDSLGADTSVSGSYIGMMKTNAFNIVSGIGGDVPRKVYSQDNMSESLYDNSSRDLY